MRLSNAGTIISAAIKHNIALAEAGKARDSEYVVPMLWGAPGLGKTTKVQDETDALGIDLKVWILAQYDAGELGGFPMVVDGPQGKTMRKCRPADLPLEGTGVLFLDEFPQAPLANQNVAAQLLQERRIGEHRLGDGWTIVCAGNDIKHRAGTNQMPSHVKGRMIHLEIEADTNDALDYFNSKQFRPELTGYIRYRPEYLHKFDADAKASPTPRNWERVNSVLGWGLDEVSEQYAIAGAVGAPAAADFSGWLQIVREIPDPDQPFKAPMIAEVPNDPAILYALMASLAARVDGKTIKNLMLYLERVPNQEFVVVCMKDALKRNPALAKHANVTAWLRGAGAGLII